MNPKKLLDIIARAFCTGVAIAIGGTVFLSLCSTNKLAGAFLFSLGLFLILNFGMFLFTGKVGYIVQNGPSYIGTVALIWLGNLLGTFVCAKLILLTRYGGSLKVAAETLCAGKVSDTPISLIILGFFCGILMFCAADGFKKISAPVMKLFVIVMPVSVFIMCGFEHSIADMFYFAMAGWTAKSFAAILIISFGNALGGMFLPFIMMKGFVES